MINVLRWVLVPVAGVAAWYVAFFGTLALGTIPLGRLERSAPPAEGTFVPDTVWLDIAVCFGAGAAALLIVLFCTYTAPAYRAKVAVVTFAAGALLAVYAAIETGSYAAMTVALLTGALTTVALRRHHASRGAAR